MIDWLWIYDGLLQWILRKKGKEVHRHLRLLHNVSMRQLRDFNFAEFFFISADITGFKNSCFQCWRCFHRFAGIIVQWNHQH